MSVIILTKDAGKDLPECLRSLDWCDDIHVVDSGSSDDTVRIAQKGGAHVLENPFLSFGIQRNWAIDNCRAIHPWILFMDADERSTPAFSEAMNRVVHHADDGVAGFYCCWKTLLGKRWLRRSDNFPKWQLRLFRKGRARFIDVGHGQKEGHVDGRIDYLREPYLHDAFSMGWPQWEAKHRKYACLEAEERMRGKKIPITELFSRHGSRRNIALKGLVVSIPCWPQLRFLYSYVLRCGWLEGREGLEYCRRMMWYESQIRSQIRMRSTLMINGKFTS